MACCKFRHLSKIIVCFFESRRVLLKEVFCQSAINHLKFLEINETKGSKTSCERVRYSKVAGLYQFFPKKLAGSQAFLKHFAENP